MADTSLWPIVLTGVFALGGSLGAITITSVATRRRDAAQERRDDRKRRADKFEELAAAVYEFDHWIVTRQQLGVGGIPQTVSPFAKVQSISSVYFPQFSELVRELNDAAYLYYRAGHVHYGSQEYLHYLEKREALLDALKKFAHQEFQ